MRASTFPRLYRAYDPETNKMLNEKDLIEKGFSLSPDGLPSCKKENLLNVILSWFSGQLDTNNIRIYEGDICKCDIRNEFGSISIDYGIMRFDNKSSQFYLAIPSSVNGVKLDVVKAERVGNEFENPELLPLVNNEPPMNA